MFRMFKNRKLFKEFVSDVREHRCGIAQARERLKELRLEKAISQGAGRVLEKIELFDIYLGAQIPEGKKSVAFSVYLRSADSTLTDKEIEDVSAKIIKKLELIGAELRK